MKLKVFFLLICAMILITGCVEKGVVGISGGEFNIELNDTEITTSSSTAVIDGSKITITSAGNYNITGKLTDGQIIVDAAKTEVNLILNNVDITCSDNAPIYILSAKNAFITVTEGTTNTFTDGTKYTYLNAGDTEPNATIFSKADLTIRGLGVLNVKANYHNAIASKDSLIIENADITADAKNNGIKGKDFLVINNSTINVTAGNDGIKSTNDKETDGGYVALTDSIITITAVDEAIQAIENVTIKGGTLNIDTRNNGIKTPKTIDLQSGTITIKTLDDAFAAESLIGTNDANITVNGTKYNLQ